VNIGVGGLGFTQAATQGLAGYGQGQLAAKQLAYEMAMKELLERKNLGEIDLNQARGEFYRSLKEGREKTTGDLKTSADMFRTKYPKQISAATPDNEAIRLGQQLDEATVVAPARPAPRRAPPSGPTSSQLHQLKMQRLSGRAGYLLDQGKDPSGTAWTPQTLHDQLKTELGLSDKDDDDLIAAVHTAWRQKKGNQLGSFQDFLKSRLGADPTANPLEPQ